MINVIACLRRNQGCTKFCALLNKFGKHLHCLLSRLRVALSHHRHDTTFKQRDFLICG
jgi:hypothetical protein